MFEIFAAALALFGGVLIAKLLGAVALGAAILWAARLALIVLFGGIFVHLLLNFALSYVFSISDGLPKQLNDGSFGLNLPRDESDFLFPLGYNTRGVIPGGVFDIPSARLTLSSGEVFDPLADSNFVAFLLYWLKVTRFDFGFVLILQALIASFVIRRFVITI